MVEGIATEGAAEGRGATGVAGGRCITIRWPSERIELQVLMVVGEAIALDGWQCWREGW